MSFPFALRNVISAGLAWKPCRFTLTKDHVSQVSPPTRFMRTAMTKPYGEALCEP